MNVEEVLGVKPQGPPISPADGQAAFFESRYGSIYNLASSFLGARWVAVVPGAGSLYFWYESTNDNAMYAAGDMMLGVLLAGAAVGIFMALTIAAAVIRVGVDIAVGVVPGLSDDDRMKIIRGRP